MRVWDILQVNLQLVVASLVRGLVHLAATHEVSMTYDGISDDRSNSIVLGEEQERTQS